MGCDQLGWVGEGRIGRGGRGKVGVGWDGFGMCVVG